MTTTMSSQSYLDEQIVFAKQSAKDYEVRVTPEFKYCGETYRVVLDGHHSLEAAKRDGAAPRFVVATKSDCEDIDELQSGDDDTISAWLERHHSGEAGVEWYDVETGSPVW